MKYLIVGLGNPGPEYQGTRHNMGFMVLDALARASSTSFSTVRYAERAQLALRGRTVVLIKPNTFMNLSGKAVRYWLEREKVPLEGMLVVVDDLALPVGHLRVRARGSDGGHNGLKNIAELIQSTDYPRLRLGIGHAFRHGEQIDYVLSRFSEEEQPLVESALSKAQEAVQLFVTLGVERTMNVVNTGKGH